MKKYIAGLFLFAVFLFAAHVTFALSGLEAELDTLKKELPRIIEKGTDLDEKQAYVEKVLRLREKILKSTNEEETGKRNEEKGTATNYRPLTLRLVSIEGPENGEVFWGRCVVDYKEGSTGGVISCEPREDNQPLENIAIVGFSDFPTEIVLGQPFEIAVDIKWKTRYKQPDYCIKRWADEPKTLSKCVQSALRFGVFWGWGGTGNVVFPRTDLKGDTKFVLKFSPVSCEMVGITCDSPEGKKRLTEPRDLSVDYTYAVESVPAIEKYDNILFIQPEYLPATDAGFVRLPTHENKGIESSMRKWAEETTGDPNSVYAKIFRIYLPSNAGSIALHYQAVMEGGDYLVSAKPYQHPDLVNSGSNAQNDRKGESDVSDVAVAVATNSDAELSGGVTRKGKDGRSGRKRQVTGSEAADAPRGNITSTNKDAITTPGGIDPTKPVIARYINAWLKNAEPIANASGADLHFDKWGRVEGRAVGGIITLNARPDNIAGRTPEQYVWDMRDELKLDSVDHCTLGEYVTAKLNDKLLDHCKGRYKPKVSDVAGMSKKQAEAILKGLGLKTKVSLGTPASSAKDSMRVERTIPDIGATVNRSATVTIVIHTPFVDTRRVPEFTGRTTKEILKKIKNVGLSPVINMVRAASSEQTGRVQSLDPPPGTDLKSGATVRVDVFGPYVRTHNVPDVTGYTEDKARDKLTALGLKLNIVENKTTGDRFLAGTVASQMPEAGTTVKVGKTIELVVYKQSIPDCTYLPGSEPFWDQRKQQYYCECSGDYERNNAGNGCRLKKSVQLTNTQCSSYGRHAEPRWNDTDEKVYCYCEQGYEWNNNKTECRMTRETLIANTDCSSGGYYGEAFWDNEKNEVSCRCKSGYRLDSSGICVEKTSFRRERSLPDRDVLEKCYLTKSSFIYMPENEYFVLREKKLNANQMRYYTISGSEKTKVRLKLAQERVNNRRESREFILRGPFSKVCDYVKTHCKFSSVEKPFWGDICGVWGDTLPAAAPDEPSSLTNDEEQRRQQAQEPADRQRECRQYLGQLNDSVLKKRQSWLQAMYLASAYASDCDANEIRAAQNGHWHERAGSGGGGGRSHLAPAPGNGISTAYGDIDVDPNMPTPPEQCPTLLGASMGRCLSDAEYDEAWRDYQRRLREYNSRR